MVSGERRTGKKLKRVGLSDSEVAANFSRQEVVNLCVARQRRSTIRGCVVQDGVAATLAKHDATYAKEVTQEVTPLHSAVSRPHGDRLATRATGSLPPGEGAIGLENQGEGFLQIAPGFFQGSALRVDAGDFFDECDVPSPALLKHGCIFAFHGWPGKESSTKGSGAVAFGDYQERRLRAATTANMPRLHTTSGKRPAERSSSSSISSGW